MKRLISLVMFASLVVATIADSDTKIATRDWVIKQLATSGIRVSTATTTHNTNGTFTVTCPFTSDTLTNCVLLSLTFTEPAIVSATPVLRKALLRSAEISDNKVQITLTQGAWTDAAGNEHTFDFGDGYVFTWPEELPEIPSEDHVCELDANCYCIWHNKVPKYPDDYPEEYRLKTMDDFDNASFADIISWIDTASWEDQTTVAGKTRYWITDIDGSRLNLEQIGKIDLWRNSVSKVEDKINERLRECCEAFLNSCKCIASNPQHSWQTSTCGSHSWSVCQNNPAHTSGTEQHQYPGSYFDENGHSCVCGQGEPEGHGTLVIGTPVAVSGMPGGWTRTDTCPKNCGFSKQVTHTHHFTDCGTCDAGDDCNEPCTGCSGNHVWGSATRKECAKCECPACTDCAAKPPSTDITLHSGWRWCAQDYEDDNDDGTANGKHCQCQCLTYGHNAAINGINASEHDYQLPAGMDEYEPFNDEKHYQIIGQCSRCDQWKKQKKLHVYEENPYDYDYLSPSVCRWKYKCKKQGCGHTHNDDTHAHSLGSAVDMYEAVTVNGQPKCRYKKICGNCQSYVPDDTHDHVLNPEDECKCQNGCGYQFEHAWRVSACGNEECSNCGKLRYSQHTPPADGWTDNGNGTHTCPCGKTTEGHAWGEPELVSVEGWTAHMRKSCTKCPAQQLWDEDMNPCKSGHVLDANSPTCECLCRYYSPSGHVAQAESLHNFADTKNADGVKDCTCKCGRYHVKRAWTAYRARLEETVGSTNVCGNICSYCTLKSGTGLDIGRADDSEHTPREHSTCGCKCGRLTANGTNLEKFHMQKPGTCRCYGADGYGGSWHFRHPKSGCPNVCAFAIDGQEHLAASKEKERGDLVPAAPKDHVRTGQNHCGCACGTYGHSNVSEWNGQADLHNRSTSSCKCYCTYGDIAHVWPNYDYGYCVCACEEKKHRPIYRQDGKCPLICQGHCGGLTTDKVAGSTPASRDDHAPKLDGCGCVCGEYDGRNYTEPKWHHGTGSPSCLCECGYIHNFVRSDCRDVCLRCGWNKTRTDNGARIHTFPSGQCECNCGAYKDHKFASNSCVCYCDATTRSHIWILTEKTADGTYTCVECGREITKYNDSYECQRSQCGETGSGKHEEGHDPTCGETYGNTESPEGRCGIHDAALVPGENNSWYCPVCKQEEEGGSGGGGGGNETGGNGGLGDI